MKNMLLLAAALTVVAAPAIAHAQPTGSAPTTTPAADEQNAQGLSDQAYDAYEKGNFAKAISLYLASYKLVPTAEILYNVASVYEKKLNDPKLALEYYRRHNAAPDAKPELVGKATARIAALQAQIDSPNGSRLEGDVSPGTARSDTSDSASPLRTVGVVVGAVGVAGIGVGVVTWLLASGKHSDAKNAGCANNICPTNDAKDKETGAATLANISTVGFIAGGALFAGGVAMYLLAPKGKRANTTRGSVQLAPQADAHSGGLTLVGRF